jgi:hypothetical protein
MSDRVGVSFGNGSINGSINGSAGMRGEGPAVAPVRPPGRGRRQGLGPSVA